MGLIDTNPLEKADDTAGQRIYVIRRVSGHLRKDGLSWTFLFFCDQIPDFEESHYVSDIPGQSMPCLSDWISGSLNDHTPDHHCQRLVQDGFGLVVKVLREIKSSWKLFLNDLATFLEDVVSYLSLRLPKLGLLLTQGQSQNFHDDELIEAAEFLGRQYLLNIDYFRRQLLYHQRYINYLTSDIDNRENNIVPTALFTDLDKRRVPLRLSTAV